MSSQAKTSTKIADQLFFTLPTMIVFTMAILAPFIYGLVLTFADMATIVALQQPLKFVGFNNYIKAFNDAKFWAAMGLTVKYVIYCIIFVNLIGFSLASLVTSGLKGQNFFRTSLFTPNLIGGLVLGYIWRFIFVSTLPAVGEKLQIELLRLGWLGDEKLAFLALVIVTVWQLGGYMMIIFIAGLIGIPKDVLEAGQIDGAIGWRKLYHITLPLMAPAFVVTVFMTLKSAFMVYDINYGLTAGGPYGSTVMASMHIVSKAFQQNKFSIGQAQAIFLFVIVAIVSGIQVYYGKKKELEA
jgi:raffinose/stachyose/melibiose transport system permease protein